MEVIDSQDEILYTISKSELHIPDYLKGTYFDNIKTKDDSDTCKLNLDELLALSLDSDITNTFDRCMINRDDVFLKLLRIIDDIGYSKYIFDKDICEMEKKIKMIKYDIIDSDEYDFQIVLNYLDDKNNIKYIKEIANVSDKSGQNILLYTCKNNMQKMAIKVINAFGENCFPEHKDIYDDNALTWACYNKMNKVAIKLINTFGERCIPDQINICGNTALIFACKNRMKKTVVKLINKFGEKCLPHHANKNGWTALIWSCHNNTEYIVMLLLDKFREKCNSSNITKNGKTALDFAKSNNMNKFIKKLIK